jgi:hypothetical protein
MASSGSNRTTEEPQRVDSDRADAEWKADSGLGNLVHDADGGVSSTDFGYFTYRTPLLTDEKDSKVDRSAKANPFPKDGDFEDHTASGDGSRGIKGWTGDGKGPLNPDEDMPKKKQNL